MERVFISHGRQHEGFARVLAQDLEENGFQPWLALTAVEPGQAIAHAVREAAESCDGAVLVLGAQEPSSWVRTEWSLLLEAHWGAALKKLVAVLIDDAEPPGFLKEARVVRGSSDPAAWRSVTGHVVAALRLGAMRETFDPVSRERLRNRLDVLTRAIQALEPADDDLRLSHDLRNLLTHASSAELAPNDRASVLQQLATLNLRLGDTDEAEQLLRNAIELLSPNAPSEQSASASYTLGVALLSRGELTAARGVLEEALAESDLTAGATHPLTAAAAYNLGWTLARLGEENDARESFERAVRAGAESLGPDHATVGTYRKALEGLSG